MTERRRQEGETKKVAGLKLVVAFWWLSVATRILVLFLRET